MMSELRFACIVGAPRCGTTTLAAFLQQRADVAFSLVKEPHFFSRFDLGAAAHAELEAAVEAGYLARYFPHLEPAHAMMAEGSVSYLYAPERMEPILRLWPDARFVIALRDPLAMLPSLHQRLLYTGDETETSFERAWDLMPDRLKGRRIPRTCIDPRLLQYEEIGRLGRYTQRFLDVVGRERCHVVLFDDLAADPRRVARRLQARLGLPFQEPGDLGARRCAQGFKFGWLQRLLKRPPIATRAVLPGAHYRRRVKRLDRRAEDPAIVRSILAVRKRIVNWNKAPAPPIVLSPSLRQRIVDALADDVQHLSRVIDRDLGHWLNEGAAVPAATARAA